MAAIVESKTANRPMRRTIVLYQAFVFMFASMCPLLHSMPCLPRQSRKLGARDALNFPVLSYRG
jgi:hypothetical protein